VVAVVQSEYQIRPMRKADLDAVVAIEHAAYPYPWSRGIFGDCLRIGYCCRVVELDGAVSGYAILAIGAGEAHLLNLCVARERRRVGLGQALLDAVEIEASLMRAHRLFLEVRPSNHAALGLYKRNEFRVIGRRRAYYPAEQGREDALVLVRHLDGAGSGLDAAIRESWVDD